MRYNGWENYETWDVQLWVNQDPERLAMWLEAAKYHWKVRNEHRPVHLEPYENAKDKLAMYMQDTYTKALALMLEEKEISATVWADLLSNALTKVMWHEIAGSLLISLEEVAG